MSTNYFSAEERYTLARPNIAEVIRLTNALPEVIAELWWTFEAGTLRVSNSLVNIAPGQTVDLPLGAAGGISNCAIAAFGVDGHMIARYPSDYATIYRFEQAAIPTLSENGIEPLVLDASFATDPNNSYQVTITNLTKDTWDGVTIAFGSGQYGTAMFECDAVSPEGTVTFDLPTARDLTGYCFAIWVNGLRAILRETSLQFPDAGLMTPLRAAQEFGKIDAYRCRWIVEAQEQ